MAEVTLDQVIERYINLGEKDPRLVSQKVIAELGASLLEVAEPYLEDFISEKARHRLGAERRKEVARITPRSLESREILLKSIWIPSADGFEYKPVGHVTADEFESRAAYMDRMIAGIAAHSQWCRNCAAAIRSAGVTRAGELTELPPLPEVLERSAPAGALDA